MIAGILLSLFLSVAVSLLLWYFIFEPAISKSRQPPLRHGSILQRNETTGVHISSLSTQVNGNAMFIALSKEDGSMIQMVCTDPATGYKIQLFSQESEDKVTHQLTCMAPFVFDTTYTHVVVAWDNLSFERNGHSFNVLSDGSILKDSHHVATLTDVSSISATRYPLRTISMRSDSSKTTLPPIVFKFKWYDDNSLDDVDLPQAEVDLAYNL
jgi:hypothetical protein